MTIGDAEAGQRRIGQTMSQGRHVFGGKKAAISRAENNGELRERRRKRQHVSEALVLAIVQIRGSPIVSDIVSLWRSARADGETYIRGSNTLTPQ